VEDAATARRIFLHPNLAIGEAFMDGKLIIEKGDVYELLELCMMNMHGGHGDHWPQRLMSQLRRWSRLRNLSVQLLPSHLPPPVVLISKPQLEIRLHAQNSRCRSDAPPRLTLPI
jgi:hypothetical protein